MATSTGKYLTDGKGGATLLPFTHARLVITEDGGTVEAALLNKATREEVPTKTSELENDLGFLSPSDLASATVNNASHADMANNAMRDSTGNVIVTTYATKASVPTKVSQLTNDSGFTSNLGTITAVRMNGVEVANKGVADLGSVVRPRDIQDLATKMEIPTKVSDLENDNQFVSRDGLIANASNAAHADNASIATSAQKDSDGNTISTTYIRKSQYDADIMALNAAIQNGVGTTAVSLLAALLDTHADDSSHGATAGAIVRYVQTKAQELINAQLSGLKVNQPMTEDDFQNLGEYVPNSLYLIYE